MKDLEYIGIYFVDENRRFLEYNIIGESYEIIYRDLDIRLNITFEEYPLPEFLAYDDTPDIPDPNKKQGSNKLLYAWAKELDMNNPRFVFNPIGNSGTAGTGSIHGNKCIAVVGVDMYKKNEDVRENQVLHCLLHEFGHTLGAKHTDIDSIMCYGNIENYEYAEDSIREIYECLYGK